MGPSVFEELESGLEEVCGCQEDDAYAEEQEIDYFFDDDNDERDEVDENAWIS